jgi:hypothetical protein
MLGELAEESPPKSTHPLNVLISSFILGIDEGNPKKPDAA